MHAKKSLIRRHKNPFGLGLRVVTYCIMGFAIWSHQFTLIVLLAFIDTLNWFFMPEVNPENESKIVNAIIEKEIAWLKSPTDILKILSITSGVILVHLLALGLWHHSWLLLSAAFAFLIVLKQLLLKSIESHFKET